MPTWLTLIIVVAAVGWLFLTTDAGQRLAKTLRIRRIVTDAAPDEDVEYLLRVCGGDSSEAERRVGEAWKANPEMTEAQAYRRAIRAHLRRVL